MVKWEYKIISDRVYNREFLNSLGDEGWELCGVATPLGGPTLFFKRKVCVCYSGPPD